MVVDSMGRGRYQQPIQVPQYAKSWRRRQQTINNYGCGGIRPPCCPFCFGLLHVCGMWCPQARTHTKRRARSPVFCSAKTRPARLSAPWLMAAPAAHPAHEKHKARHWELEASCLALFAVLRMVFCTSNPATGGPGALLINYCIVWRDAVGRPRAGQPGRRPGVKAK
jgi:hypothetical protein